MASPRTTLTLAVGVVGLAGYLLLFDSRLATTDELASASPRLLPAGTGGAEAVRLRRDAWTSALLERAGHGAFRLVEPREGVPDAAAVAQALSILEFLEPTSKLAGDGGDPGRRYDLGLEPPRLEVGLRRGEEETVIGFGKEAPGGGTYLHVSGSPDVAVVRAEALKVLDGLLDRLVEPAGAQEDEPREPGVVPLAARPRERPLPVVRPAAPVRPVPSRPPAGSLREPSPIVPRPR